MKTASERLRSRENRSKIRGPNFFIVGAPKCATTSLYHYLQRHPDIHMSIPKEALFFGSDLSGHKLKTRDPDEYLSYFRDATDESRVGEATVWYLYSRRAAREIRRYNPDSKIIVMIRNPVDAMYALHNQFLLTGNEDTTNFRKAVEAQPARKRGRKLPGGVYFRKGLYYTDVYRYAPQIERFLSAFDPRQIRVIRFREFTENTRDCYERTLRFLGVDPRFRPSFKIHNPNGRLRTSLLRQLVRKLPGDVKGTLREIFPVYSCVELWRELQPYLVEQRDRPPLTSDYRRQLTRRFRDDNRRLGDLLDQDFSDWLNG